MKLARADLIAALRLRYDHYSAETVFEAACKHAGLPDQAHYDRPALVQLRASLVKVGDRLARVNERLDDLVGEAAQAPQAIAAPAPVEPPAPEPPKPAQAPQSTAAPETANARPAEKKAAKSDAVEPPGKAVKVGKDKPSRPETGDAKTTRIVLTGLEVDDGERVLVCGDRADLGNWDPEKARPMTQDGDAWIATIELGDGGEFKFLRRTADGTFEWEPGENRDLKAVAKIEASWQR